MATPSSTLPTILIASGSLFVVGFTSGYFVGRPSASELTVPAPAPIVVAAATPVVPPPDAVPEIARAETSATPGDGVLVIDAKSFSEQLKDILANKQGRDRFTAVLELLRKLDPKEVPAAMGLVKQFTSGFEQNMLLAGLVARVADVDPLGALNMAKSLDNSQASARAMQFAINTWSQTNPAAALGWIQGQPVSNTRSDLIATAMRNWSQNDPRAAWTYAISGLKGPDQAKALGTIAGQLTNADPSAAAQLAAQITDPASQAAVFQSISGAWARIDPTKAKAWLSSLPVGPARDAAVGPMVQQLVANNPQDAFAMAATMANPADRVNVLAQGLRPAFRTDADAATASLQSSGLSANEQKAVIQAATQRGGGGQGGPGGGRNGGGGNGGPGGWGGGGMPGMGGGGGGR